jgi:hypothetical protein
VLAEHRVRVNRANPRPSTEDYARDAAQRNAALVEVERCCIALWERGYRSNPLVNRAVRVALAAGLNEAEAMTLVAGALLEQNAKLFEDAVALLDRRAVPRITVKESDAKP